LIRKQEIILDLVDKGKIKEQKIENKDPFAWKENGWELE
jgi:hypothetical protein